jgi:uracil-DNA glycosylase
MSQLVLPGLALPAVSLARHAGPERIQPKGPEQARILVVGEAPGRDEIALGLPFVGASGRELMRMLTQAGINPDECRFTNVFLTRPVDNKIENYCGKKLEVGGTAYQHPPLSAGKYFFPELLFELVRLAAEVVECRPDLIIALGNTACWALLGQTGISKLRGNKFVSTLAGAEGFPVIPTYHPAAVMRQWDLRVIAVQDFIKCNRFVTEGFSLPQRRLLLDPTLDEVRAWVDQYIWWPWKAGRFNGPLTLDIETKAETITMIGFAPSITDALCIPFLDPRKKPDQNYWTTFEDEWEAYLIVKKILESPIPKLGQNGLYDIQYCFRYGWRIMEYLEDTMILHHSRYPELEKGLGFMGSVYTDEAPWKLERARNKENFKQDDE